MSNENIEDICKEAFGSKFENLIRQKIMSNLPPPNAPSTIKSKGSSTTLIDTTNMVSSVKNSVESSGNIITVKAGILDEDEEVAKYAAANEYGVTWERRPRKSNKESKEEEEREWFIPPRSFIRSTFDENFEELLADFESKVGEYAFRIVSRK